MRGAASPLSASEIEAALRGERGAVCALTRAYLPRVFALSLRLARRRDLAEEATQETFVRALRSLSKLRDPARLSSWILTIAANTTRELRRKESRSGSLDYEPACLDPEVDDLQVSRQKAVELALCDLPEPERELFLLHTVEGVRLRELAEEHATSVSAMKSRVHRIRSKVRVSALAHMERVGMAT